MKAALFARKHLGQTITAYKKHSLQKLERKWLYLESAAATSRATERRSILCKRGFNNTFTFYAQQIMMSIR